MKTRLTLNSILFLFILLAQPLKVEAQQAGKELFNDDWVYHKGDMSLEAAMEEEAGWKQVSVPHDWSIEESFSGQWASGTGFLPGGIGWYKKTFKLSDYSESKRYAIYFDGIYKNSEVWINGQFLGKRPNGFIPFQYDLSSHLKADSNTIIVRVDHSDYADSRYYTGSGIYRNVYMISLQEHHFSQWGVFFQTPEVSKEHATAKVQIGFENHEGRSRLIQIRATLKEKGGTVVSTIDTTLQSQTGNDNNTELNLQINHPELWSPASPYLYDLVVSLRVDGKELDVWEEKVGIRDFKFDANKGFSLNDENMLLKGVCIHHDAGALGAAVHKEVWEERLKTLKELGANAIRMSHYPHQDYLYDLCDELGFLVQDEAFDEWEVGKNKWIQGWNVGTPGNDGYHVAFEQWGQKDLQDMIRRNRNRPSIIMWSIGNEIDYPNDPYSHPILDEGKNPQIYGKGYMQENAPASRLGELAAELVNAAKIYDTTRPITAALAGVTMSNHTNYPSVLDVVGYNYQEYRYKEDHEKYPERVIYGSENGDALEAWWAVVNNEYISSQFLWTAFDFIGEAREWPVRSSGAGIIDLAGKPKPDFYFRKSLWNDTPMAYLGIAKTEEDVLRRNHIESAWIGNEGEVKWVTCYTNTEEVELLLNGKSLGRQQAVYQKNKMISWEVPYSNGLLIVKGYNKGTEVVAYSLQTPGEHMELVVETNMASFGSKKNQIIFLDILLADSNGNRIINNDQEVSVQIKGPAKLMGLENGDLSSHEDYQANRRRTYKGKLRGYIQTNGQDGNIEVEVSTSGLPSKEILVLYKKNE